MLNVICVKIGTKYSSLYVNNLLVMCRKNITEPFNFICYTDDPLNIDPDVIVVPFVNFGLEVITHNKLYLFSKEFDSQIPPGPRIFFDLDLIIKTNIDHVVSYNKGHISLIYSYWRHDYKRGDEKMWHMFNSSCMTWQPGYIHDIWDYYEYNIDMFTLRYHLGMDSFLSYEQKNIGCSIDFFPKHTFYSFLWGVDYDDNFRKSDCEDYIEKDHKDVTDVIPIVLLNGPTTFDDYQQFKQYYAV